MGSTKRGGSSNRGQRGRRGRGATGGKNSIGARHYVDDQFLSDDNEEDLILLGQLGDTTDSDNTDDELADGRSKHARRKAKIKKAHSAKQTGSQLDIGKGNHHTATSAKGRNDKSYSKAMGVDPTHSVRAATQPNDLTVANDSDTDNSERDVDLNNLLLEVGNLDINDDAFDQLLHTTSSLTGITGTKNNSNDDGDKHDISITDMTDDDILQILLMCETDNDMHRFLAGLDVDELDRIDTFFDHSDDDDDDDILDYEEQYLARRGLYDDDEIAPEMFQRALEETLAQVPTGLKPGVKNWLSHDKGVTKKQKQQEKKQQKKETKAKKRYQNQMDTNTSGGHPSNTPSTELWNMDRRLCDFITDNQLTSLQFAPMDKISRRQLHTLSTAYNLTSKSLGQGKLRSLMVTKAANTCIPQDRRNIELFIHEAQSTITVQQNLTQKHRQAEWGGPLKGKKAKPGKKSQQLESPAGKKKAAAAAAKQDNGHGTVVAQNAAPITESNVGHRMMLAMGWKQGNGLGTNQEGITDPIEAVIRGKRRGLGA